MKRKTFNIWSDEDVVFLQENYAKLSATEIAKKLNRTCRSVKAKAANLHLVYHPVRLPPDFYSLADTSLILNRSLNCIRAWCQIGRFSGPKKFFFRGGEVWGIPKCEVDSLTPKTVRPARPSPPEGSASPEIGPEHKAQGTTRISAPPRSLVLSMPADAINAILARFDRRMPNAKDLDEIRLVVTP